MKEVKYNAIDYLLENADVLFHQCNMMMTNAQGTSHGIAGELIKRFPEISHVEHSNQHKILYGDILGIGLNETKTVVNMYSQYYPGRPSKHNHFNHTEFTEEIIMNPEIYPYKLTQDYLDGYSSNVDLIPDTEYNRLIALKCCLKQIKEQYGSLKLCCPRVASGLAVPYNENTETYFNNTIKPILKQELEGCDLTICYL